MSYKSYVILQFLVLCPLLELLQQTPVTNYSSYFYLGSWRLRIQFQALKMIDTQPKNTDSQPVYGKYTE